MSIYGVELLPDNAEACRHRMFEIWNKAYSEVCGAAANDECRPGCPVHSLQNILCGDALTMKQDDGEPIIFAEWSFIDGSQVKRRDFRLDKLIETNEKQKTGFCQSKTGMLVMIGIRKNFSPNL